MSDRRADSLADDLSPAASRGEPELFGLRKRARALARERKERPSTVHLLAAVCATPGPARELLLARKLDEARLLSATRASEESSQDPLGEALAAARELMRRRVAFSSGSHPLAPSTIHVLVALLSNRRFAAQRVLEQCGVDIARLRTAAMRVVNGSVHPPRPAGRSDDGAPLPRQAQRIEDPASPPRASLRVDEFQPSTKSSTRPPPRAVEVAWIPSTGLPASSQRSPSGMSVDGRREMFELDDEFETSEAASPVPGAVSASPLPPSIQSSRLNAGVDDGLDLDPATFPLLTKLGRNLSAAALRGALEPVIGRSVEVERALDILAKRHANNPLLVGAPGVGKTSVARALARRLIDDPRRSRMLVEVPVGELLSGTGSRGSLAERIADLRAELARADGRVVLFIDEIHELFGGAADEAMGEIKAALAAGDLPLVGATAPEQQRKFIDGDPALARRFTVVEVDAPGETEACELLTVVCERLALHHEVAYHIEAIEQAVGWSARYIPSRALPDKALAILDLAGARVARKIAGEASVSRGARYREPEVDTRAVAEIVSEMVAVPVERLLESDGERMLKLEQLMSERVVGHRAACGRIAAVLRRNAAGLRGRRPIGSFLLLGPTGVGKTETAKAIAELLFHSPEAMTRLDMSEYAEAHAVARLVGAPPGYVGHESGGLLTEAVRKRPYQVLLLDEIEKAHRDVLESFLQVFDEGRLTDGRGRTADFTNTVIVLTSNLGAEEMRGVQTEKRVGFAAQAGGPGPDRLEAVALRAARVALPPELYNRLDEVLFFAPLGRDEVAAIARRLLAGLGDSLARRGVALEYEPAVVEALMDAGGFEPELGARPMRRAVSRLVEAPLADRILTGDFVEGSRVRVAVSPRGAIVIEPVGRPASARRTGR
ncbi:MAG: ATP-dependent Clp protease ATP-binding subunit [Deltaproteobacteria bacterium]|nr:ATP-dependent Clp protease ATP-binding subunit [Deltaproteobacteria bacterium]